MPTIMRIVTGNASKVPINEHEPTAPPSATDAPEWLDGKALEKWNETAPRLIQAGLLTALDREMWIRYCVTWELWWTNKELVRQRGDLYKTKSGHIQQSPAYTQMRALSHDLARMEQQFGMTPAARSQINLHPSTDDDPLAAFVKKRGAG
jgi:P27 family predicted phage terminase small subunit